MENSIWKRIILKFTSFKNILATFCAVLLGFIVFTKSYEFKELGYGFLIVIGENIGANVLQKKIEKLEK